MSSVRVAELADVPSILAMGLAFMRETVYGQVFRANPEKMTEFVTSLIDGSRDGRIFVAEDAGKAVAMLGVYAYEHFLFADYCVVETFWYADPAARGSVGIRLLKAAEQWARDRGAEVMQMIAPHGAQRVYGIYKALGYTPVELSWQKRLAEG